MVQLQRDRNNCGARKFAIEDLHAEFTTPADDCLTLFRLELAEELSGPLDLRLALLVISRGNQAFLA
ncbi:hypothetical protein D769_13056 [Cupriavidus sp. HMR-1]|nr:hypothetical protein D769_13056 [Cupriavidus sp. HMR-1]